MSTSKSAWHGELKWAVRSSFRDYVASLPDGEEHVSGGAAVSEDGRFVFPPEQTADSHSSTHAFRGTLTFVGHAGVLRVEIRDPQVHLDAARGTVSVESRGGGEGERSVIAAFTEWEVADERLIVPAPRLTWFGVSMLGEVYEIDDVLDPIEIGFGPA